MPSPAANLVALRPWEYAAYTAYNTLVWAVERAAWELQRAVKTWLYRASLHPWLRTERYLDPADGLVKTRRYTGAQGTYRAIGGELVKVSHATSFLKETLPLRMSDAGYYDEELGCHIENKDQYRAKMKEKGFVPWERNMYGKSHKRLREERLEERMRKSEKRRVAAFKAACQKAEAQFGVEMEA